jgi:hypothetical protein
MTLREWETAMQNAGATRLRLVSVRKGEYTAEAVVARGPISVSGEDMETVCARLLERCREA